MADHHRTQDTTLSHAQPDNFRPADAIESLRAAILRVDTLAQIANDAADELHGPVDAEARRVFERMQILVEKAAEEASAALVHGDELMAALTKHLQTRRDSRGLEERRDERDQPARARHKKRASSRARARGARRL